MTARLWVPGPLPGMNEMIAAAKGHGGRGYGYSKLKRTWTDAVHLLAKAAKTPSFKGRVRFHFLWMERDLRRDPDNVAAGGRKLVLDGLVAAGVLAGDGHRYVRQWSDDFDVRKDLPGVSVVISAVE